METQTNKRAGELVQAESRIFNLERALEAMRQRDDCQEDIIESLRGSLAREQAKSKQLASLNAKAAEALELITLTYSAAMEDIGVNISELESITRTKEALAALKAVKQ